MEKMKRVLALLLVFAMLMPNLSTIALAADTEDPSVISTEPAVTAEETEASAEETETPPQVTEPSEEETQPPVQETEPPATEETQVATETAEETVEPSAAEEAEEPVKDTVTVTSQQEAAAEQTAAPVSGQAAVTVLPDFGEDFVNDKVFAVYIEDQFLDNLPVVLGTAGRDRLPSDATKYVYDVLKARIEEVAAGKTHSTVVAINVEEESKQLSWTKEDLGVDALGNGGSFTQEASVAIKAAYQAEMDRIMKALLVDCPYDLYWFDKTVGMYSECELSSDGNMVAVPSLQVYMSVASGYQGSDQFTTTTDLSRVQTAAANAQAVAELHKDKEDYEKLTAFKEEICSRTSYNTEAAKQDYTDGYGDPWQLIYVFDGDEKSEVVCEGYAKAFQYLCELSDFEGDVESFLVSGYAEGPHMWNIVSIAGRNYLVDVTNSEAGCFGENGELFMAGAEGSIEQGYTFYIENDSLTYFYSYEAEKEDGTKVTIKPSIDLHGTKEDSVLNLSDISYEEYLQRQEQEEQPEEIVEQDPYISLYWLRNRGNGWYEDNQEKPTQEIGLPPSLRFYMIAYLNEWNEDDLAWEQTPIHASKLVVDENLVLEPFWSITDGDSQVEDGENADCFFRLSSAEGTQNLETKIAYSNTGLEVPVYLGRYPGGFYSADPTSAEDRDSLWLNEVCISPKAREFYFWFDASRYHEAGWSLRSVTLRDPSKATATKVEGKDNLWKITISEDVAKNIYAMHEIRLGLDYEIVKNEDSRKGYADVRCNGGDFGRPNASFVINGKRYNASWSYQDGKGLFCYEGERQNEYPVPASIPGVSYDLKTNTLTLNGAHLNSLEINHHWRNDQTGEEGWNLPDSRFNIELVGKNTISATDTSALFLINDVHLTIQGNGSLDVSMHGTEDNSCHAAVVAEESDLIIADSAKVTVHVSGVGYYMDEAGNPRRMMLTAISGHGEDRTLRLAGKAVLTTDIPADACINGTFATDGTFIEDSGYQGIRFYNIEVDDEATLNTQAILVWYDHDTGDSGTYRQHGGTVNVTGQPSYNRDYVNDQGVEGNYHFSGIVADYGDIEINGGQLNIDITATDAQKAKSVYYHALQSRGGGLDINGSEINITGNISGTGIKVGEDNWEDSAYAWFSFNQGVLNMTGSQLYRCAVDVAPGGSAYFNGGQINAHRADINIRGDANWNSATLNATESNFCVVQGGTANINYGRINLKNGNFIVDSRFDENGNLMDVSHLNMDDGYVTLDNGFVYLSGSMRMKGGALEQSLDFRKLTTEADFAQAFLITPDGRLEISGGSYLEITGLDKVDGLCNEGVLHQKGGTIAIAVDQKTKDTAALFGHGRNQFENGYTYLEGYYAAVLFNRDNAGLYVSGYATVDAFGKEAGIQTFAPVELSGGKLTAFAACEADPANDIYPVAFYAENNDKGTDARLNISGGSHYFACFEDEELAADSRGLWLANAPVTLTGGELDVEAAVVMMADGNSEVTVPVMISNENGASLTLTDDEALGAKTLLVGENYARSVAFRTSRNCGDTVTWKLEDGVLTISGTGAMDDYHMPIRDPQSWRTAPWYAVAESITKVVVEEGVTYIGDWAFGRLPNVTEIHYPSTVSRIDMTSNYACPSLTKFVVDRNNAVYSVANDGQVLIENGSLVRAAVKTITSYAAGDAITTIGMGAFDSTDLAELDLNKVQVIQNYAFADCYNLKDVVIPEGIATIEMTVFQNSGLQSITIPASVTKIRNYAFDGCADLADVYYSGSETQWNAIAIGPGNNALTSIPVTFLEETQEQHGEPYLSYRLLTFGDRGYYEDMGAEKTKMTIPVGFYPSLVVYCNYWNPEAKTWERFAVDPEQLYAVDAAGNRVEDLEIGPFRYYEGIGIEDGIRNAYNFFEMAFRSGWGSDRYLCLDLGQGKVAKLPVKLARGNVGFYSADPTNMSQEQRNAAWLNLYRINPNVSGHSVYFALTEYDGDFSAAPSIGSSKLSPEDLAKVQVTWVNDSVYKITLPDDVAAKVHDYRGIPLQVTYRYGDVQETVEFIFGSVSFAGPCVSFVINGVWYEYYEGLVGYFGWDEENDKRLCYKELPGGMSYDYASDTLTMNNSTIKSLQVYWNWHDENTGESGYATKDSDLTLKLIGENKIINPGSNAALAVGNGLTLTITGDENSSLLISATNEYATAGESCQNAVNVYDNGSLIIAGDTSVTTSISGNENMTGGWLMNLWGNGNNTLVIKDNATLTTTLPVGARDDGDAYVNGYRGIDWFGEVRVQDNAKLNTSTLALSEYYDENWRYYGKGTFVQTGGTVTIEAMGYTNEEGRHNYHGFAIGGNNSASISGGKLIVKANEANVAADRPGEENTTYAWFDGIRTEGRLDISGENTLVDIQAPDDGTGLSMHNTSVTLRDGATLKFTGNGNDQYALSVNWKGKFQLNGGHVEIVDAKARLESETKLEIHDGTFSVVAKDYPYSTYLESWRGSEFILHNGDVVVNNGFEADDSYGYRHSAVSIGGTLQLNGGTMTVTGTDAMEIRNDAELYQNGAVLKVNGCVTTLVGSHNSSICLNGGITEAVLGKTQMQDDETGNDGGDIDLGGDSNDGGDIDLGGWPEEPGMIIDTWSSAVNIYDGGDLTVSGGHHTFRVAGTPADDIWLSALDVNGTVSFNGGTVLLDAGEDGQAIFNRTYHDAATVFINNDLGAVSAENGTPLQMQLHGADESSGEQYYVLGNGESFASNAKITSTSAGDRSSWRIEKDGSKTTLIISGDQYMYDYYMPENDSDWNQTPWFDYNDQITHVVVESGIQNIGDWVFARMSNLVNVTIPDSVNHISTSAFFGCPKLESFTMQGNSNYYLDENTRTGPDADGYYTGTVIIGGGWKILKAASTVTTYTVPAGITEISNGAFRNCTNLTSITFERNEAGSSDVRNIGNNAFENSGLKEIVIPNGVKSIGRNAFANCGSATEIILPDSVNTIRPYAFSGCSKVTTVTFTGTEEVWNKISIGSGNTVLDKVVCMPGAASGGADYLSFRWLSYGENGWEENEYPAETTMQIPGGFTFYGVFFYNHFDGTKWEITPVIPEAGAGVTIEKIDENILKEYDWKIPQDETHGDYFIRMIVDKNAWDGGEVNYGVLTYQSAELDIRIQRNSYGFYSAATASNETWLNDYVMNPLKKNNEFYFIYEGSDGWKLDESTFHIWNDNGASNSDIRMYACGNGVYRIVLDPVFMQDAWQYGYGIKIRAGFEQVNGEERRNAEAELQLKVMDLGTADAIIAVNDREYLYFAEENGWMIHGDPANDWRPGVAFLPAGVSYDYSSNTLTMNNAKLNNLNLRYRENDENGHVVGEKVLPNDQLTLNLIGSSVIETGHCNALNISGGLKVTVNGTGSLYLHSHNSTENKSEDGHPYAFDTLWMGGDTTLTIAGGNVTAEISGEGYWNEHEPAMPAALRGRDGSHLEVTGGSLTTVVPEHARDNGPGEVDFEEYYSTHAIAEFDSITVTGGTLTTTSLYMDAGSSYEQTGGTVNITGLGHASWQQNEYGGKYQNYHYNGLQVHQGATAKISGGLLNVTVTPRDWEHGSSSYYSGLSIAGGTAEISGDAKIHVTGAYDGCAISVGHDYDDNGQPCAYGKLTMTGGTLTVNNTVPEGIMNGVEVHKDCTADISGGNLDLTSAVGIAGIGNNGELTIGGNAKVTLTESVWSNGLLTVKDNAEISVVHEKDAEMYAWDILPDTRFDFQSGTITAVNSEFVIDGEMNIGKDASLILTDSDFRADGQVNLNGGQMKMIQDADQMRIFLGMETDEWGNTFHKFAHQSELQVTGALNLNSGKLELKNTEINVYGGAINQNNADVVINNQTEDIALRRENASDYDDWMVACNLDRDAILNINGGTFTMNGINLNVGLQSEGTINISGGVLTMDVPAGIPVSTSGVTAVSGGTVTLKGDVGYQHWYNEGNPEYDIAPSDHGKLTVTGGTMNISGISGGIDVSNNMVVTGGEIHIDVAGRKENYTNEDGVPVKALVCTGLAAYNSVKPISVSINGGIVDIQTPVEMQGYDEASIFGLAAFDNGTVRINGGDVQVQSRVALYAESQQNSKHIVINKRLQVLSLDTGNTLDLTSGVVEFTREGKDYTWYIDTCEEDETFTTPYLNYKLDGYATNLKIVNKTAGRNAFWDMENGVLTISAPSGTIGTMVKDADWNLVAEKITRLVLDPSIDKDTVDLDALKLMTGLKSIKTPHNSAAEAYGKQNGITVEYFHQPDGDKKCTVDGCALAAFTTIVEDDTKTPEQKVEEVKDIPNEDLKQELENSQESAEQFEQLEKDADIQVDVTVESKDGQEIPEELDVDNASIIGAKMNVEEDTKKVALVIGQSSQTENIDTTQYEKVIRFSMELTTTDTKEQEETVEELKTPVQITLPLPKGMDVNRLEIFHYHGEGEPEKVNFIHTNIGGQVFVSFWVSGFSDFDFRMIPQKLQVVLENKAITYGDTVPALTWKVLDEAGNETELPEGVTVTPKVSEVTKAGAYSITAEITKTENANCEITVVPGNLIVAKQKFTVTMDDKEITIGDAMPEFTYTAAPKLPDGITICGKVAGEITMAGEYKITAEPVESDFYAVTVKNGKLTVKKQPVTVTLDDKSMKAGENQPELTYKVTDAQGNALAISDLEITPKIEQFNSRKGGIYTITAFVADIGKYEVTIETARMTVVEDIAVTINDATVSAGNPMPAFDFTVPEGVKKEDVKLTFTVKDAEGNTVTDTKKTGTYTITATPTEGENPFYNITVANEAKLTVEQALTGSIRLRSASLNLLEKICIIYYASDDLIATRDEDVIERGVLLYETAELAATKDPKLAKETVILEWNEKQQRYGGQSEGIDARDMNRSQFAVAYVKLVDGTCVFGTKDGIAQTIEYSPLIYCRNKKNDTSVVGQLCRALMHYGAAAQVAQYGMTSGLMNEGFDEIPYDASVLGTEVFSVNTAVINGMKLRSASMDLKGAISYLVEISVEDQSIANKQLYAEYSVLGETNSVALTPSTNNRLRATIQGIAPKDMGATLRVKPYYLDENGAKVYGGELVYSAYEYVRRALVNANYSNEVKELAKALAMYVYYADKYGN